MRGTTKPEVIEAYVRARYWYGMALSAERANRKGDALSYRASCAASIATAERWSKRDREGDQ